MQPSSEALPLNGNLCVIGEADPFIARLLQRFAEKSGFQVRIAQTGEAVLAFAQDEQPSLVILEPELPGKLRGWEAALALNPLPGAQVIPLILCTWLSDIEAQALVGRSLPRLQKPDLHYNDFMDALSVVGMDNHTGGSA